MQIATVIQKLGFKKKEAQVYLAALLLGESRVSDLAAKVKLPRTSVNVIIEKLHREGMVNYYWKKSQKYWTAVDPEHLLQKLQEEEATLKSIMPELKAMRKKSISSTKPSVHVYTGAKEMRIILEDIITSRHHFQGIVAWRDLIDLFGEAYVRDFTDKCKEHFLQMRLLTPESETTRSLKAGDRSALRETRFLSDKYPLNTAHIMYGNKVAIISLTTGFPTGFLIEDADVHNTMLNFFEKLWERA